MMINVAGGLEHDVSLDECKCFCANSKTSRRYAFDCLSATYYHDERDCILNLDDRNRSPQLLEEQKELSVTYIGPTCGRGSYLGEDKLFVVLPSIPSRKRSH
ncbi:unnamed protein product [Cylicostephanus goldi]|uniref:Apple domain-containing protein n=1 Tax=Cylicostephanus goldi TaxID=71465 RepID=A0A3P6T344_CYLGO|nr:unnamed protein product [Cylicostephanus goldi]